MSLSYHVRTKIILVQELEIKAASKVSDNNEVLMLLLTDKIEGSFEISEGYRFDVTFTVCILDLTPTYLLNIGRISFKVSTIKGVRSVRHIQWSKTLFFGIHNRKSAWGVAQVRVPRRSRILEVAKKKI